MGRALHELRSTEAISIVTTVPDPPAVVLVGLGAGCVALRRYVGRRATA
jgi:hypothetical protein